MPEYFTWLLHLSPLLDFWAIAGGKATETNKQTAHKKQPLAHLFGHPRNNGATPNLFS